MSTKKQNPEISKDISLTPSTLKLNQLRAGKGPGMLTQEEIQLLRKSKKEMSEVFRSSTMAIESNSTLSLMQIRVLAINALGSESIADEWLNKFHPILGNTPIAVAESSSGLIEIKKILSAINFGNTA